MSDMKCPFCQQELVEIQFGEQRYWSCINDKCNESVGFGGNLKLWQKLIRTRKALDVARNGLEHIFGYENVPEYVVKHIRQVLDQIKNETTLIKGDGNE